MSAERHTPSGVDLGLAGAVVLITGGARGVGAGIAGVLNGLGAVPVICGRTAPDPNESGFDFHPCDVRDSGAVSAMIAAIVAKHGRIHGVVNNAGGSPFALAADASDNFARKIVELNLVAPLVVARAAHAVMSTQPGGGAIVNTASASGLAGDFAVAFLLSPLAAYVTGSALTVHGGGEKPAFLAAGNADNRV